MEQYQFKTNINCSGCIANVTPMLNKTIGENNWKVDTQSARKVLTVVGVNLNEADVIKAVNKAGYKAEKLS